MASKIPGARIMDAEDVLECPDRFFNVSPLFPLFLPFFQCSTAFFNVPRLFSLFGGRKQ
jgi:hypothetical protein